MQQRIRARENWRPCPGHEGYYEVSDLGRVRSVERRVKVRGGGTRLAPARVKELSPGHAGYITAQLWRGNRQRKVRVHTLVLEAFVGPAPAGMECRHLDGIPSNNQLSNLRWGTSSENKWDRVRHGNHPAMRRLRCPRGHRLVAPNLTPASMARGHRNCLACKRAHDNQRYALRMGHLFDLQARADKHYRAIMEEAAQPIVA